MSDTIEKQRAAVRANWTALAQMVDPPTVVIEEALAQSGWAIQYIPNPSEELQLKAIETQYDAIKFIQNPTEAAQRAALGQSYQAIRYIQEPSVAIQCEAVAIDEKAVQLMAGVDTAALLRMVAVNPNVLSYKPRGVELSREEVADVLAEAVSLETVDRTFMARLIACPALGRKGSFPMSLTALVDEKGSGTAKRLFVDIKLRQE